MSEGWLAPSVIVSAIGTLATIGTLFFMRRTDRREGFSDRPAIGLELRSPGRGEDWMTLAINVRNRSDVRWELVSVEFTDRGVRGASEDHAMIADKRGGSSLTPEGLEAALATGPIEIGYMVQPAGSPRSQFSSGDSLWVRVPFKCSRALKRLSIRLVLQSTEPNARPILIRAKRNMPRSSM